MVSLANKIIGIIVVLLGLLALFRLTVSGTWIFLIIAAVLAIAAHQGWAGRWAYALAGIFVVLAFAGFAIRSVFFALAILFKLAPILLVLVGIYLVVRAFSK